MDEVGYVQLPNMVDPDLLSTLQKQVDLAVSRRGVRGKQEIWLDNVVDIHPAFDGCWSHPVLLAAAAHVLGWNEMKLYSFKARIVPPGEGGQDFHADWREAVGPDDYQICNSVWPLDDLTADNGATRVVPGSHRWGRRPQDAATGTLERSITPHLLEAPAGSCTVFNAHIWHSGTPNTTPKPRRVLLASFVRRHHPQQIDQRDVLRPATVGRLTPSQRYLLDV
ncbi:MAG TPA: phytanoyl-CoA dioxygenase family protein [Acidimicrobiales bacterium]|nr:phytanoyl-CoA dioxygenase family protein [Acidimicrobiales bacterium]